MTTLLLTIALLGQVIADRVYLYGSGTAYLQNITPDSISYVVIWSNGNIGHYIKPTAPAVKPLPRKVYAPVQGRDRYEPYPRLHKFGGG